MDEALWLSPTRPSKSSTILVSSASPLYALLRWDIIMSQSCSSCGRPWLMVDATSQVGWASGRLDSGTAKSRWSSRLQHSHSSELWVPYTYYSTAKLLHCFHAEEISVLRLPTSKLYLAYDTSSSDNSHPFIKCHHTHPCILLHGSKLVTHSMPSRMP